jgi:multiple sugar transport system permease protein
VSAHAVVANPGARRPDVGGWIVLGLLVVAAVIWLLPFAWALATSLKPDAETTATPISWTGTEVTFDAYRRVFESGDILRWYFNSFLVAAVVTGLTILSRRWPRSPSRASRSAGAARCSSSSRPA